MERYGKDPQNRVVLSCKKLKFDGWKCLERCKNRWEMGWFWKWVFFTFLAFSHLWSLPERPNWFHTINWQWATCTSKRWALLEGRGYLWASKVDFWKRPKNGHFSAVSQRNFKISRPANSLAIPLHWPFLPKSCLTTLESVRSKNMFFPKPLFGPYLATLDPPKVVSGWPKPLETPDT